MSYKNKLSNKLKETYLADNFLDELKTLINNDVSHRKVEYLELFDKLESQELNKEIWHGIGLWWCPSEGYLALLDKKEIVRYTITLSDYPHEGKLKILSFLETYHPKKKISYSELLAKSNLDPSKLILTKERTFYEDNVEAFEITANSVSSTNQFGKLNVNEFDPHTGWEKPIGISSKYLKKFNLLVFKFEHENTIWRRGAYCNEYSGCISMNNIEILLSKNKETKIDSWF